jgi:hypothetical protein
MGRLIPAGTGVAAYKQVEMFVEGQSLDAEAIIEAATPQMISRLGGGSQHSYR